MPEFNLEKAIKAWKKHLQKYAHLEPGDIDELENHLYESVDSLTEKGFGAQSAFEKASSDIENGFEEAMEEYRFSSATHEPKSKWFSSWWIPDLLPNIFKVLLRNFKRKPGYSFINISGLAIGLACCFLIFLHVNEELNYDTFHEKPDRIYRIDQTNMWANFNEKFSSTGPAVGPTLLADFPEIETMVRVNNPPDMLVTIQNSPTDIRYFEEPDVLSADSTFFDVFTMEFVEGDPKTALDLPYSFVITEKTRQRYFDNEPALGKAISIGNPGEETNYQITGVVKEMPENSHFDFDLLSSLSSNPAVKRRENTWIWTVFATYVVLNEHNSIETLREKLQTAEKEYAEANIYRAFNMSAETAEKSSQVWNLYLTPITDIHLNISDSGNRIGVVSDVFYVYVFSSIALLIIVLAVINFMNLSSAQSVYRAKEVGIRKTLGSQKLTLIGQFLAESVLFSFIALIFALMIVFSVIESFNQLSAGHLSAADLLSPVNLILMVCFTVFTGLLSGLYPAFYLTSFNPIEAFKGKLSSITNNNLSFGGLRNFLVVFQFAISVMLISCSIIIYQQLNFIQNKNLGFDKENVLIIENVEKLNDQTEAFKQLIEQKSGVLNVAETNAVPPQIWNEDFSKVVGAEGSDVPINSLAVDADFISTMKFKITQGRDFEKETEANARYVILNETAVEQLNWSEGAVSEADFPLGKHILFGGNEPEYEIVGVVEDFNIASLHSDILPIAIFHESAPIWKGQNRFLVTRVAPGTNFSNLIENIEVHWNEMSSGLPFDFTFLDDQLFSQYETEQRIATVVSIFTGLAIFIAILGLLGLISFSIEKRTKEIGVRKVMGASSGRIVFLLSKDMSKLIIVSVLVAIPASWLLMENWLQNFVYRIDINAFIFLLSGITALVLAWMALSYQTIKAAMQNPIKSLKNE